MSWGASPHAPLTPEPQVLGCWGCLEPKGHLRVLTAIPIFPAIEWDCLSRQWEQQWGQHRTSPGSQTLLGTLTPTSHSLPQLSQCQGLNVSTGHQDRPNTLDPLAVHFHHSSLTPSSHCLHCVACDMFVYVGGRESTSRKFPGGKLSKEESSAPRAL